MVGWEEKSTLQYLNTIATACEYAEGSKTRAFAEELAARLDGKTDITGAEIKNSEMGKLAKLMLEEQEQAPQKAQESMSNPTEAFRPAEPVTENAQESQISEAEKTQEPVVINATTQAFEAQGIETTDALARASIVDRLLSGDTVSNRELERIGSLKDRLQQRGHRQDSNGRTERSTQRCYRLHTRARASDRAGARQLEPRRIQRTRTVG